MKVTINHRQKTTGLIRKTTFHGVAIRVEFSAEELAVIRERQLEDTILIDRSYPADMSDGAIAKHESRGLGKSIIKAAISGADALHFDLNVRKLVNGEDVYFFETPLEAKGYEEALKEAMVNLKGLIVGNAEVEKETATFEL